MSEWHSTRIRPALNKGGFGLEYLLFIHEIAYPYSGTSIARFQRTECEFHITL